MHSTKICAACCALRRAAQHVHVYVHLSMGRAINAGKAIGTTSVNDGFFQWGIIARLCPVSTLMYSFTVTYSHGTIPPQRVHHATSAAQPISVYPYVIPTSVCCCARLMLPLARRPRSDGGPGCRSVSSPCSTSHGADLHEIVRGLPCGVLFAQFRLL